MAVFYVVLNALEKPYFTFSIIHGYSLVQGGRRLGGTWLLVSHLGPFFHGNKKFLISIYIYYLIS